MPPPRCGPCWSSTRLGLPDGSPGPYAQYLLNVDVTDTVAPTVTSIEPSVGDGTADRFLPNHFQRGSGGGHGQRIESPGGVPQRSLLHRDAGHHDLDRGGSLCPESGRGAHLATIHDAPTQAYLQQWYAHYSPWIGLTDQQSEGNWQWADAQEVTYTHWGPGEPNDTDSRADYALLGTDGLWYDDRSYSARRGLIDLGPIADSDGDQVPDMFDVYPSDPLNAWDVREAGADGQFDTPDDVLYSPYLTATYVSGTSVSLALRDGPLGTGHYRLTVSDTITDRLGNALDGDGDLAAGAPYHYEFEVLLSGDFVFEGRSNAARFGGRTGPDRRPARQRTVCGPRLG